jgi:hypothetical protein
MEVVTKIHLQAHPERRYKAALAAYKERELPIMRKERPGLRLQQYEEIIFKVRSSPSPSAYRFPRREC